jgi:carboxyl-terminal processing protease
VVLLVSGAFLTGTFASQAKPSETVSYVQRALEIMDTGLYADTPAWRKTREQALQEAARLDRIPDSYPILRHAVAVAGGRHSAFYSPQEAAIFDAEYAPGQDFAATVQVRQGVGILVLPTYGRFDPGPTAAYIEAGAAAIVAAQPQISCGWVVDVQNNLGGNAFAMLAAVSPLLSDGPVMRLRDARRRETRVEVRGGTVTIGGEILATANRTLADKQPPLIAVLQSPATTSAGEWIVAAFHGQTGVTTLGRPTMGLSSSNNIGFSSSNGGDPLSDGELSDGGYVKITQAMIGDRAGHFYDAGPIPADQPIVGASGSVDDTRAAAEQWMRHKCSN